MTDEMKQARMCENRLFKQLYETAESMREKLNQDPGMENLLKLISAMNGMRIMIFCMDSSDPETAANGREMFSLVLGNDGKQMADEIKRARVCENVLFKKLFGAAMSMHEKLTQDPGTKRLLLLIYSMEIIRTMIFGMDSPDPETAANGQEMFSVILRLGERGMTVSTDEKKKEAIERMKIIGLDPEVIEAFEKEGLVSESVPPSGTCHCLTDEQKARVKDFEAKYSGLVYHVIHGTYAFPDNTIMEMECYLFVDDNPEEWLIDRYALANKEHLQARCYVYNNTAPELSKIEAVKFNVGPDAGLLRRS